jgi:hypothetical protein
MALGCKLTMLIRLDVLLRQWQRSARARAARMTGRSGMKGEARLALRRIYRASDQAQYRFLCESSAARKCLTHLRSLNVHE